MCNNPRCLRPEGCFWRREGTERLTGRTTPALWRLFGSARLSCFWSVEFCFSRDSWYDSAVWVLGLSFPAQCVSSTITAAWAWRQCRNCMTYLDKLWVHSSDPLLFSYCSKYHWIVRKAAGPSWMKMCRAEDENERKELDWLPQFPSLEDLNYVLNSWHFKCLLHFWCVILLVKQWCDLDCTSSLQVTLMLSPSEVWDTYISPQHNKRFLLKLARCLYFMDSPCLLLHQTVAVL